MFTMASVQAPKENTSAGRDEPSVKRMFLPVYIMIQLYLLRLFGEISCLENDSGEM